MNRQDEEGERRSYSDFEEAHPEEAYPGDARIFVEPPVEEAHAWFNDEQPALGNIEGLPL